MKNLALYTISISPHITSYWKEFHDLWSGKVKYYYKVSKHDPEREKIGWQAETIKDSILVDKSNYAQLEDVDILIESMRDIVLIEKRLQKNRLTFYASERWFKPPLGFCRLFVPSYFKMAKRFVKAFASPKMYLMPQGIHAARDMARLIGFMQGNLRCLFKAPKLAFESRPGGHIVPLKDAIAAGVLSQAEIAFGKKYGFVQIPKAHWGKVKPQGIYAKMRLWGYFVEPSITTHDHSSIDASSSKVLWVGRMLDWKRTKDLVKACGDKISLSLYGKGPEEENLKALAKGKENISLQGFVPTHEVRNLMHQHDIYVLPSDGGEGWGAVTSEALEEGMCVFGTVDAGSTATILPPTHLYKAGDVKRLELLLSQPIQPLSIGEWSAKNATRALQTMLLEILEETK